MIINNVIVNNFLCFIGENNFSFKRGLNIVSAPNTGGKSQLVNAFHWTFFDKVYLDDNTTGKKTLKISSNGLILCPDQLKNDSLEGDKIITTVEISLSDEYYLNNEPEGDIVEYFFKKKVVYQKSKYDVHIYGRPEVEISFIKDGETHFILNHNQSSFLEKIFPSSIRRFMWYQGETMDDLYDFSNTSTLKNAIREISYFPMYDNMEKIVKASNLSINKKIEKELSQQNKLSDLEKKIISEINTTVQNIENKKTTIKDFEIDIENLRDEEANIQQKLSNYDKYRDVKEKLATLEADLRATLNEINNCDSYTKESLLTKWMLNGCEKVINGATKNLNIINGEIQAFQKSTNPVPFNLPGADYIERMLQDCKCYICEREANPETPEYEALKRRLDDFEKSAANKTLQENYTELNRARRKLLNELPDINNEIKKEQEKRDGLIKERNRINKKIRSILDEFGEENGSVISSGAATALQLVNKWESIKNSIVRKRDSLNRAQSDLERLNKELSEYQEQGNKIIKNAVGYIVEKQAGDYISMFVKSISKLSSRAHAKLINEIQEESNKLYSLYLGGKQQGLIEINNGIKVLDKLTNEPLNDLSTAETVARKLAVANAFLSLSEKKMNRSYPIVADAPTSDFDANNTYNLTVNIGDSFEQMIIMSKDYISFSGHELEKLISDAKISKFYELKNALIDENGVDSRINRKTYIKTIK